MPPLVNEHHPFQLDVAFAQLKRQEVVEKKLLLVTGDSSITTSSSTLLLFSPWLRSILSSLPCSPNHSPTTILIPDISTASLSRIIELVSLGSSSSKCNLKEVIKTVGDARLLNIDISDLVEVAEPEDELKEDKQALRESLRLERVADENEARLSRVENLLQRARTELADGEDANDEIRDEETIDKSEEVTPKKIGPKASAMSTTVDPNSHECQKCGQHLPEASIHLWEHYTNHYTAAILRDFGALHKEGRCIKCFKSFTEREMVFHLGIEHHKVNDALRKDGFTLLLNQIKSEPYDLKERVGNMFLSERESKDDGGKEADMEDGDDDDDDESVETEKCENAEEENGENNDEEAFCCELCGTEKSEIEALWKHYIVAHKEIRQELVKEYCPSIAKLKCDLCGNRRNSEERLVTHVGIVHLKLNEILRGKGLATLKLMKRHQSLLLGGSKPDLTVKAEEDFMFRTIEHDFPEVTEALSKKEEEMKKSKKEESSSKNKIPKCQICSKTVSSLSKLWQHYCDHKEIRTGIFDKFHSKSKTDFTCDICGNLTKDLIAKVKHMAIVHELLNTVLKSKGLDEVKKMKFKDEFAIGLSYLAKSKKEAENNFTKENETPAKALSAEVESENPEKPVRGSISKCKLCEKEFQNGAMKQHYIIKHFMADFREHDSEFHKNKKCNSCGKVSLSVIAAYQHYGVKHGGLDMILRKKALLDGQ